MKGRSRFASAWRLLVALAATALGALTFSFVRPWLEGAAVLLALSQPRRPGDAVSPVGRRELVLDGPSGPVPARLYLPQGRVHRCVVVGHGVHYLGIDEPRLVRFATDLAAVGTVVLTPELADLADYRITASGRDVLGVAVRHLSDVCRAVHEERVGLIGFSFAGGLSMLAAAEPDVALHLAYVASVGGYVDLRRVLDFLLTDTVHSPHGLVHRKAHEYGIVVLLYEHLDAFVPEEDRAVMHDAIRAWLHEDRKRAWALASRRTTEAAERLFVPVATGHFDEIRGKLEQIVRDEGVDLAALSPTGKLRSLAMPAYFLHGSSDSVIPPEETLFADEELRGRPHLALVTPLLEHVELNATKSIPDALSLVNFMAHLL
jgi:dienelactone hydrolase